MRKAHLPSVDESDIALLRRWKSVARECERLSGSGEEDGTAAGSAGGSELEEAVAAVVREARAVRLTGYVRRFGRARARKRGEGQRDAWGVLSHDGTEVRAGVPKRTYRAMARRASRPSGGCGRG